jgi:hypothetical protein
LEEGRAMVGLRTHSQAAIGPRLRIDRGTIPVSTDVSSKPTGGDVEPETQYVDVSERTIVAGELSKIEQILEYLKALYR